ncbi:MAG: bestrophin family ion channel [Proteobacteria bacterium]|nr:bestrophin family ion channel [Pseudomonadota bacterium]
MLHRVLIAALYAGLVYFLSRFIPNFSIPITPFEYSGAVLALILVMRVNAGHDRWWEARKLWGSIVNQSRNLATATLAYNSPGDETANRVAGWAAAWPYVMKNSLRSLKNINEISRFVGASEVDWLNRKDHMPSQVGLKVARLLNQLRVSGMDNFAFQRAETERSALIDAIGACERIKSTRMPFVLAVKTRRFILLFLLLLPIALIDRVGLLTPLVMALAAYPLFSLDEIGAELQNPFSERNLSHLPLDRICDTISSNIMNLILENQTEQSNEKVGHSPLMVPAIRPGVPLTSIDRMGVTQTHKI